jgi:chitin synthase
MIAPMVSCLPIQAPSSFYAALEIVRALTHCTTAKNPSFPRYSALSAKFDVSIGEGEIVSASLALSKSGIDTKQGLLSIPPEAGFRAFDAFYYLVTSSSSPKEKERLDLKPYSTYHLLKSSSTFSPPSYVPTADDAAAAEDFRNNLKTIGIKGRAMVDFLCTLTGLLKLGDAIDYFLGAEEIDSICDSVSLLLDVPKAVISKQLQDSTVDVFIAGVYEALIDWVIERANAAMQYELRTGKVLGSDSGEDSPVTPVADDDDETVSIRVISVPNIELGKAAALRTVFEDSEGINAEMKEDGVEFIPPGSSVLREMQAAIQNVEPDLGIMTNAAGHERERRLDRREGVLEAVAQSVADLDDCFLSEILHPVSGQGVLLGTHGRFDLASVISSSRVWFQLSLHPTDDAPAKLADLSKNHWSAGAVSSQLRAWRLPEWANRRNRALDYTADFGFDEFFERYAQLGCQEGKDGVETWLMERGWSNGEVVAGHERVWMRESAWWEAETMLEMQLQNAGMRSASAMGGATPPMGGNYSVHSPALGSTFFGAPADDASHENLLQRGSVFNGVASNSQLPPAPSAKATALGNGGGDYGLGRKGDTYKGEIQYENGELEAGRHVTEVPQSKSRKLWVILVWTLTFWIPSPLLSVVGRMKRPDVRLAWREKLVLVFLIFLMNAFIVFYIIEFGRLLCPNFDKAWLSKEVAYHQGQSDYWVSHGGKVYDLTKFWRIQHSDSTVDTTSDQMLPFAGTNVDELIRPPLTVACPVLVTDTTMVLIANTTVTNPIAVHTQGDLQTDSKALKNIHWYTQTFLPKMKEFYKGDLVWSKNDITNQGQNDQRMWFRLGDSVYDLTDYFYTRNKIFKNVEKYQFFGKLEAIVTSNPGADISAEFQALDDNFRVPARNCLENYFYIGRTDFRTAPRCQVNNYLLLAFTIILCTVISIKFLSALQLGSKRKPSPQDKFVICQVPAYTEGEEQLRKGLDSLTSLAYDNKRKLICVICDGMVVGGGNDRPTPKIVLDILGVDPSIDPPALPFKSVGEGSEQLNYGKVYSGLYEYEGNVVPYIVVVKVGKESEQIKGKPGNRGKRDSQILLMSFLNRVHHRTAMSPLELEMYHQISNVIGVDPELYEYLMMVDADTMVMEDSLNRLVAVCANDSKIAGICGETSLDNEDKSWWTMIQVYEYYISHNLAKAFESLFGSVTCLPGW